MQIEGHVQADRGPISVVADLGFTIPNEDNPITLLWSRSHYLEWRQHDTGEGWYARGGRFMPTYGLRLAEHTAYTRRFGGTPLFSEAYGASVGWVTPGAELHLTGFVHDRWQESIEDGDGAAVTPHLGEPAAEVVPDDRPEHDEEQRGGGGRLLAGLGKTGDLGQRADVGLVPEHERPVGGERDAAQEEHRPGHPCDVAPEEVDFVIDLVTREVSRLREMSPLFEMVQAGVDLKSIEWAAH